MSYIMLTRRGTVSGPESPPGIRPDDARVFKTDHTIYCISCRTSYTSRNACSFCERVCPESRERREHLTRRGERGIHAYQLARADYLHE